MDRRERFNDQIVAVRAMLDGRQANMWTALPGIVISYDAEKQTCEVQPAIQGQQLSPQGVWSNYTLKPCLDCPVIFPSGGGFTTTFPIAVGDEGLLVFSSRCIDAWWQNGGVQPQADLRMHDPSDGFFIPGARSQANKLTGVSTNAVQLRSNDGHTLVEVGTASVKLTPDNGTTLLQVTPGIVKIVGALHLSGPIKNDAGAEYTQDISTAGNLIAGFGTGDSVGLKTHTHSDPQGGNTGPPNAGT